MKGILRDTPFCQWCIGRAVAYRLASNVVTMVNPEGRSMFRAMMRSSAKCAILHARMRKGAV